MHVRYALLIFLLVPLSASYAQDQDAMFSEPYNTGWQLYLDNNAGKADRDYTGGFAITLNGARTTEYPISLNGVRGAVDRWVRFNRLADSEPS